MMAMRILRSAAGRAAGRPGAASAWLLFYAGMLLASALALGPDPVRAQENKPAPEAQQVLEAARGRLDDVREQLRAAEITDAALLVLRGQVEQVRQEAGKIAEGLEPELGSVKARLNELGPAPPPEGEAEAPDVAAQRGQLGKTQGELDARLKLARLLVVEGEQLDEEILAARRAGFQARLGERTTSVFDPAFWHDVRRDMPGDGRALADLAAQLREAAAEVPRAGWAALSLAGALVLLLRWLAARWLWRLSANRVPAGRLRRSVYAVAVLALAVATPVALIKLVQEALERYAVLPGTLAALLTGLVSTLAFGGYVVGLGQALLAADRPSWRLPNLPDLLARRLRWLPWQLAAVLVLAWLGDRIAAIIGASFATTVALNGAVGLLLFLVLGGALLVGERVRRLAARSPDRVEMPASPWWISLMVAAAWLVAVLSAICLLSGYVALGSFLLKQVGWTLVVLCSAYLAAVLVEDVSQAMLGLFAQRADGAPAPSGREQAAVLLSGIARLFIVLVAGTLLVAPFGEKPAELLARAGGFEQALRIGAVHIRPAAVLQAVLVFAGAVLAVGVLRRWLAERYLPATGMDRDMSGSAATLVGYAGFVVALALGLVALGIGLERVAWIASALSVGIGFGLQAVVQNFVSGLILLAERPVKVGDWVSIEGMEGDIRRINARATEIQMGDRSTLIVPNSAFITKTVRNVTLTDPLGLVSFKLPVPMDVDPEPVRDMMRAAMQENESLLESPAPAVHLDSIDGRYLIFSATGYVTSPRLAYGVRSALLFDVIKRLRAAGIVLHPPEPPDAGVHNASLR